MGVVHSHAALGTSYVLTNPFPPATSTSELKFSETLWIAKAVQLRKKEKTKRFYITITAGVLQFKPVNKIKVWKGEVACAKEKDT